MTAEAIREYEQDRVVASSEAHESGRILLLGARADDLGLGDVQLDHGLDFARSRRHCPSTGP
jgi:hypothetical protein